ncbi:MAG: ABC transporter substrate-binding protein [Rhodothermaceae bacterium]
MKKIFYLFLVISILFIGCDEEKSFDKRINDVMFLNQSQFNSFDPIDAYHAGHIQIVKQLFNTLTDINSKGETIPSIAKSWNSSNGSIWEFNLRSDIYFIKDSCFSNDEQRKLNANDVKYSFERLLNKNSKSLGVSYFSNIKGFEAFRNGSANHIEGVSVSNDSTIFFYLNDIDFNFPNLLTLPYCSIVKKQAIEFYESDVKLHPVGTGPFILSNYTADQKIVLNKNTNYWESKNNISIPEVDLVNINLVKDENLAFLQFKNQQLNFLELNYSIGHQLKNSKLNFDYDIESWPGTQLNFYLFNLEKIDQSIRKGINFAINRNELQTIIADQGSIAKSIFPSIFSNLDNKINTLDYNPKLAKQLLMKDRKIKLVCFEDILSRNLASFIKTSLISYKINVEIEAVPFQVLVDRLMKGNYDMIQLYWGPFYADINHYLTPFLSTSFPPVGNNFNKYSNSNFDQLVNSCQKSEKEDQMEKYLEAQNIILDDMPFLLFYFGNMNRATNNNFQLEKHPLGYRMYKNSKIVSND